MIVLIKLGVILPNILLPIWLFLINHPYRLVKNSSKIFLVLSIVSVIVTMPIYMLVTLKYWILLLFFAPILFRVLEILLNKTGLINKFFLDNGSVKFKC